MKWHGFGLYGMFGRQGTDPDEYRFSQRVKGIGVDIHASPYDDNQTNTVIAHIFELSEKDGVFLWGTSLGANNVAFVAANVRHTIDGMFGFQASSYGKRGVPINANVLFAHLIYSYNPLPLPLLGAYKWPRGTIPEASYHKTPHHIPHPGDYDMGDQGMFLHEMQAIMKNTKR